MTGCSLCLHCCALLLALHQIHALAVFLSMLTHGQVNVLNAGQAIELDCEFYAETFNMFKNPVVWKKHQRQEVTEVNIMGNILPPFLSTGRFLVSFSSHPPRYRLRLRITDLSLEDSGNYSCEVRGPRANILGTVTHYLFIRAPVQSVYFTNTHSDVIVNTNNVNTTGSTPLVDAVEPLTELTFIHGVPGSVRCVSVGGYPPPEMFVQLGDNDLSERLTLTHSATLHGEQGLRLMLYRSERWTDDLVLAADDDGRQIRCVTVVSDIGSAYASAKILVNYGPIVQCQPASAALEERNVNLQCEVRARPSLSSLFWLIDVNGTTVAEGRVKEEYWTLVMVRTDGVIETRLFMRRATPSSFRRYTLYAENTIAISRTETELVRRPSTVEPVAVVEMYQHKNSAILLPSADQSSYHFISSRTVSSTPCSFHHYLVLTITTLALSKQDPIERLKLTGL